MINIRQFRIKHACSIGPSSDFRGFASCKKFGKCDSFFSPRWPRNLINSKNLLIAHLLPLSHCPKSDEGPFANFCENLKKFFCAKGKEKINKEWKQHHNTRI